TAKLLNVYLARPEENHRFPRQLQRATYPFPTAKTMSNAWRAAREQAAKKLNQPELKNIPLKNLRNYAGAVYYYTYGKDPIATKEFMRHKRLEQTMDYLRGIKEFTTHTNKIGKIVNTAEEAMQLILDGFKEETIFNQGTPQEKHILTKINI
ncbi:MAG TPA: hypothetical protein VK536_01585, partial [Candidatus Limnocylindrales bacterium]|nr:hypothetical protein [Candidatus Limnocylindrales bacterium]